MESSPFHTNHDVFCEVKTTNLDQNLGNLSADLFEEKLEEINRDLRRFDAITELHSKSNSSMGKENNLESMTINEIFLKSTQLRAAPFYVLWHAEANTPDRARFTFLILDTCHQPQNRGNCFWQGRRRDPA